MTPEELKEIRSTLEFASQAGAKDEFMDTTFNLLEFIDEQAAQIEGLKEKLIDSRRTLAIKYPSDLDSPRYEEITTSVRQQLKAEMKEIWE